MNNVNSENSGRASQRRLADARNPARRTLAANRHVRGGRVLYIDEGETVTAKVLQRCMAPKAQRTGTPQAPWLVSTPTR